MLASAEDRLSDEELIGQVSYVMSRGKFLVTLCS